MLITIISQCLNSVSSLRLVGVDSVVCASSCLIIQDSTLPDSISVYNLRFSFIPLYTVCVDVV